MKALIIGLGSIDRGHSGRLGVIAEAAIIGFTVNDSEGYDDCVDRFNNNSGA